MEQFWWLLTLAAVGWYATVTVYVAVRGAADIRHMLKRLQSQQAPDSGRPPCDE
jgi:hypothetical protein